MPAYDRRARARRKAWGRGPTILRFEPLEGRELLSTAAVPAPDLVATSFDTLHNMYWGDSFQAVGTIANKGTAPTTGPFSVNVYATSSQTLDANAVFVGTIAITTPIQPGATAKFDQTMTLPVMPVPNLGKAPSFYLELLVNPGNPDHEPNTADKQGLGQGFDTSVVTITPHQPSNLVGSGFQLSTNTATWGGVVQVSAQFTNAGPGDAPATRANIVATPAGQTPGGASDFTLGSINVPALPANQSLNLQTNITLPAVPPSVLANAPSLTLSLVQDVDFQANPIGPHSATRGVGLDSATLAVTTASPTLTTPSTLPQLAVASIQVPSTPLAWGQTTQIGVSLENRGTADASAFRVQFALVDPNNPGPALVLANTTVSGLKAGFSQSVLQTIKMPATIAGTVPPATAQGVIQVTIDPEHVVDQTTRTSNSLASSVITINLVNFDGHGTVITPTPTPTSTTTAAAAKAAAAAKKAAAVAAQTAKAAAAKAAKATQQASNQAKTVSAHQAAVAKAAQRRAAVIQAKASKHTLKVVGGANGA
jgi:CARDB